MHFKMNLKCIYKMHFIKRILKCVKRIFKMHFQLRGFRTRFIIILDLQLEFEFEFEL